VYENLRPFGQVSSADDASLFAASSRLPPLTTVEIVGALLLFLSHAIPPLFQRIQQDPLIRGDIGKVAVLILDANGALLERFVADLKVRLFVFLLRRGYAETQSQKYATPRKPLLLTPLFPFSFPQQVQAEILASVEPEDVEAALRSALLKLQRAGDGVSACGGGGGGVEGEEENNSSAAAGGALRPLPKGCTFEVVAHARSRDALPRDAWVDADPVAAAAAAARAVARKGRGTSGGGGGGGPEGTEAAAEAGDEEASSSLLLPPRGVLPLKSARAGGGALRLQVYVEGVA
jgi:hypothetical protein